MFMEVAHTDALRWPPAMGMGSSAHTADARAGVDDATLAQARVAGLAFKFSQILAKFYQIMKF